ncbi:hypothetical protein BDV24DRAFT_155556 [Aspergillus arachidicola]|uniref:Uncharacterized protein n=1 Tax=Aspergillus arachidicola TaxID=656916 RepID=A0A5N6XTC1_9EURO|nr:hypothetical protein BDV24DRAFT_155556 [Aspergillus arachidicola]
MGSWVSRRKFASRGRAKAGKKADRTAANEDSGMASNPSPVTVPVTHSVLLAFRFSLSSLDFSLARSLFSQKASPHPSDYVVLGFGASSLSLLLDLLILLSQLPAPLPFSHSLLLFLCIIFSFLYESLSTPSYLLACDSLPTGSVCSTSPFTDSQ